MSPAPQNVCTCSSGFVMSAMPEQITSANNPLIKDLRKLSLDNTAYRKQGRVWLEGDHLCRAALLRGFKPAFALFSESFWPLAQSIYARAAMKSIATRAGVRAQGFAPAAVIQRAEPAVCGVPQPGATWRIQPASRAPAAPPAGSPSGSSAP